MWMLANASNLIDFGIFREIRREILYTHKTKSLCVSGLE